MQHSESLKELAEALSLAQAEMPAAKMTSTNPFLKNKYADLGSVIDAARPVLAKYGLSISQLLASEGDRVGVETVVMHKSGQWISNVVFMDTGEHKGISDAQGAGIVFTYLRRYAFAAALAMYADEDNDGSKSEQKKETPKETQPTAKDNRQWKDEQKFVLITNGLAKDDFAAKGMLSLSCLPDTATADDILAWARIYRPYRDELNEAGKQVHGTVQSGDYANEVYKNSKGIQ